MTFRNIWDNTPPVTRNMLAITLVVLMVDKVLVMMNFNLTGLFGLWSARYSAFGWEDGSFHIWQPLTYMFLHQGFGHWFCNMFAVWMFGMALEREWGSKKYLIYYIVCGLGAALVQELVYGLGTGPAVTIGASGAVFGLLLAFAWLFPEQKIFLLFIPIPIPSRVFVAIYAFFELTAGVHGADNVAHFAHLGGALFGALLLLWWKHKGNNRKNIFRQNNTTKFHYKDPV